MQIKIHKPLSNEHHDPKIIKQKPQKMTLQQYLESMNLRRKIHSRSKSKSKNQSKQSQNQQNQRYLQPNNHMNSTIQYFKLNQQWKSKKIFNSWINNLKQLCRQFIKPDSQYIQVARLIQKIVDFVKSQIQSVKKDNLLLQSYLVTQASYWPGQGSAVDQDMNNDKISNYLKTLLNSKSQFCNSPNKSQQINGNFSPENRKQQGCYPQQKYKTSTQPKIKLNSRGLSTNQHSNNQSHQQQSSTVVKHIHQNQITVSQSLNKKNTNLQKQQYLYSFKDKQLNQRFKNSLGDKYKKYDNIHVKPFQFEHYDDKIMEQQNHNHHDNQNYQNIELLKIQSKNSQQVPRLSLMSRYDERKKQATQKYCQIQKQFIKDSSIQSSNVVDAQLSQLSTKSQIHQNGYKNRIKQYESKLPLRQRKNKGLKYPNQFSDDFQMIALDSKVQLNAQKYNIQKKIVQNNHIEKINKNKHDINLNQTQHKINTKLGFKYHYNEEMCHQTSPIGFKQSPYMISLQTPSTLYRKNTPINVMSTRKQDEVKEQIIVSLNQTNQQNGRQIRSRSVVQKFQNNVYDNSKRNKSRQNIMKRYQNYRR